MPDPNALVTLANTYEEIGDTKAAISTWKKTLTSRNNDNNTLQRLATLYEDDGDFANAIKARKEYLYRVKHLGFAARNNGFRTQIADELEALGVDEERLGKTAEAKELFKEAQSAKEGLLNL